MNRKKTRFGIQFILFILASMFIVNSLFFASSSSKNVRVLLNKTEYGLGSLEMNFGKNHEFVLQSKILTDVKFVESNPVFNSENAYIKLLEISHDKKYIFKEVDYKYEEKSIMEFKGSTANDEVLIFANVSDLTDTSGKIHEKNKIKKINISDLISSNKGSDYPAVYNSRIKAVGVFENNRLKYILSKDVVIKNHSNIFEFDATKYRGGISFYIKDNGIVPVNVVNLEEYLYSVVGKEMSSSAPVEALKSQAVAARTYAINSIERKSNKPFDLYRTTASQLYTGIKGENPNSIKAVNETSREYMVHGGSPISAFYSANNGGISESGEELYGNFPYLVVKNDSFSIDSKNTFWKKEYSNFELSERLKKSGYNVGIIDYISILERTKSGRVKKMRVSSSNGQVDLSGKNFRKAIGYGDLRSTLFSFNAIDSILNSNSNSKDTKNEVSSVKKSEKIYSIITNAQNQNQQLEINGNINYLSSSGSNSASDIHVIKYNEDGYFVENIKSSTDTSTKKTDSRSGVSLVKLKPEAISYKSGENIVIYGAGFGHGVGMSQYGARVMSNKGYSYKDILNFYYENIQLVAY